MILLLFALFGFFVPNGIFVYWLFTEFSGIADITENKLALAFIIEAFAVMFLMAYQVSREPQGKIRWPWFIILSLVGGIGFSIPFYYWLNTRRIQEGGR